MTRIRSLPSLRDANTANIYNPIYARNATKGREGESEAQSRACPN